MANKELKKVLSTKIGQLMEEKNIIIFKSNQIFLTENEFNEIYYHLTGLKLNNNIDDTIIIDDIIFTKNKKIPDPPKFPPSRIIREGTIGDCKLCRSTTVKRYIFFGKKIGCIQPECENYYKFKN